MAARPTGVALATAALLAVAAAGCTRPRHGGLFGGATRSTALPPDVAAAVAHPTATPSIEVAAALQIEAPVADARLTSPIQVQGTVQRRADLLYVAQVVVAAAPVPQRGNARVTIGADGAFRVALPYTLDEAAPGTVEVVAVDPVSGTVAESVSVPVWLAAAP